jgi:hypothetical protein
MLSLLDGYMTQEINLLLITYREDLLKLIFINHQLVEQHLVFLKIQIL